MEKQNYSKEIVEAKEALDEIKKFLFDQWVQNHVNFGCDYKLEKELDKKLDNVTTIKQTLNKFDSVEDYCDVNDNSSWTFTNKSGVEVTVITKNHYDELEQYEALKKELGLSSSEIKDCVIALKGLINTFDITCDSKVRMSDMLDGINGFPFYKDLVYHKEITKAIELLKEKNE